jgi:hypothetical protein
MSHFAKVEDGVVTQVIVAEQEFIDSGVLEGTWIQTSYNTKANKHILGGTPLRGNYAGAGMIYDAENDAFYDPQPYPSWSLNKSTWTWEAPISKPEDPNAEYSWNEEKQVWEFAYDLTVRSMPITTL